VLSVAKNYQSWWKFGEVLAKTIWHSFFGGQGVQINVTTKSLVTTHK